MPLLILDCDGVLIDSEAEVCRHDAEEFTRIGYPCTAEDIARRFIGISSREMFDEVERDMGRPLPQGFREASHARLLARFGAGMRAIPGIVAALDAVEAAGWATCIASGSAQDRLRLTLSSAGLWGRFDGRIFDAAMVARGKPAPDLFLHAAAARGAAPSDCLVVEDSTAGIAAARAAGMAVLGFDGASHCLPGHAARLLAAGAAAVFSDMAELPVRIGAFVR